jgi:hypothetical protein
VKSSDVALLAGELGTGEGGDAGGGVDGPMTRAPTHSTLQSSCVTHCAAV